MTNEALVFWIALHIGLVYLVTASAILSPVRVLLRRFVSDRMLPMFMYCSGCTGFWLGLWEHYLGWGPEGAGFWQLGFAGIGVGALFSVVNSGASAAFENEAPIRKDDDDDGDTEQGASSSSDGRGTPAGGPADEGGGGAALGAAEAARRDDDEEPGAGGDDGHARGRATAGAELFMAAPDIGFRVAALNGELAERELPVRVVLVHPDGRIEQPHLGRARLLGPDGAEQREPPAGAAPRRDPTSEN